MMKHILFSLMVILLAGCGSQPSVMDAPAIQASPARSAFESVSSVTPSPTVFQTPTPNLLETAIAGTVASSFNATSAASTATQEMKATEAFWVGVTFAVGTQQATETKIAGTQTAQVSEEQTQTAIPPTITALSLTQRVEDAETDSKVASLWIWYVGTPVFIFAFLWILLSGFRVVIRQWEEGKKTEHKTRIAETRKPDEYGRMRLLTTDEFEPGTKIINPNNSVDDVIDPANPNDLTNEQKLINVTNRREADVMHSFAHSPVLSRLRNNQSRRTENKTPYDLQVTKPDMPMLGSGMLPALPLPHYKILFDWDGRLLPFGADKKNALMQADPTINPHFLVAGKSRSGKTISSIRPMVACLLAMGWNVIVLGKRVDFMPFEEQSNFRLIAGDVRKDADKPVNILKAVTAQMDIRDVLLAEKRINTWARYGAPPTMLVIDDYSGYVERMPKNEARQFVSEVKSVSMDGAKFGLHLMLGTQSVTWENIDTTIRKQMSRIVYSVSASDSRIALDDTIAARLPQQWNFMTRLTDDSDIEQGVGFALQDVEVEAFLKSRPVKENEPMDWIDAVVTDVTDDGVGESVSSDVNEVMKSEQASTLGDAYKNATPEQKIRKSYLDALNRKDLNLSLSLIELDALGYRGGAAARKVKEVLAKFEKCEQHELADLLQKKVDEWKRDRDATTTATEPEKGDLTPDSLLVAG